MFSSLERDVVRPAIGATVARAGRV